MATKDYYKILNVKSDASLATVKQAYRKLAMNYHPDRNPEDDLSAAVFADIAEAYSVIGNLSARKKYNQQRYHTAPEEYTKPAETIESLVSKALQLKNQINNADPFHLNRDALLYSIKKLFPDDISALLKTNEIQQKDFLEIIAFCSSMLTSVQIKNLFKIIQPLFNKHLWLQQQLQTELNRQTKKEQWEKYKIVLAIVIAILLCVIIFFVTKN